MTNLELITDIYNMQLDLNKLIGRDTKNDSNKLQWLFDYTFAMEDEIQELANCIDWKWWSKTVKENPDLQYKLLINKENAIIEAIDIIHFFISLCHIVNISSNTLTEIYETVLHELENNQNTKPKCKVKTTDRFGSLFKCIINLKLINSELLDLTYFGIHITDHGSIDFRIIDRLFMIWKLIIEICVKELGLDLEKIHIVYKLKWEKNIKRQESGYDVRTKTEDDNIEIEDIIACWCY